MDDGYFVEPTIIESSNPDSFLFKEEFFVPITAIAEVQSRLSD